MKSKRPKLLSFILLLLILVYLYILAIAPRFLEITNRKDAEYVNKHPILGGTKDEPNR